MRGSSAELRVGYDSRTTLQVRVSRTLDYGGSLPPLPDYSEMSRHRRLPMSEPSDTTLAFAVFSITPIAAGTRSPR